MQEIHLYRLLKFFARKFIWILIFTALGALVGFIYNTYLQVPLYKSNATLLIIDDQGKAAKDPTLINNYIELIKSRRVLDPVLAKGQHAMSYDELANSTTAVNEKDTEVIKVSVVTKDAQTSKDIAAEIVTSFQAQAEEIYSKDNVTVVDQANLPDKPYNVHQILYMGLATAAGFIFSLIILFFAFDFSLTKQAMKKEGQPEPEEKPDITPAPAPEPPVKEDTVPEAPSSWKTVEINNPDPIEAAYADVEETFKGEAEQSRAKEQEHSLARRTMRSLVGMTLQVPERSNPKNKDVTSD